MLIVAILALLYSANLGITSIQYAETAKAALRWPVREGYVKVIRGRRTYKCYVYSVSGREYTGERFELPNINPFHVSGRFKDGQHILVYFDPAAPELSSVNRMVDEKQYCVNMIYACAAAIFGSIAFAAQVNEWCSHKQRLGFR